MRPMGLQQTPCTGEGAANDMGVGLCHALHAVSMPGWAFSLTLEPVHTMPCQNWCAGPVQWDPSYSTHLMPHTDAPCASPIHHVQKRAPELG